MENLNLENGQDYIMSSIDEYFEILDKEAQKAYLRSLRCRYCFRKY